MKVEFERDTWSWEESGIEGRYWVGSPGQKRPLAVVFRYPDKITHGIGAFLTALAFSLWLAPGHAAALAFLLLWLGIEVRPLHTRDGIWMGSLKDTIADAVGALLAWGILIGR